MNDLPRFEPFMLIRNKRCNELFDSCNLFYLQLDPLENSKQQQLVFKNIKQINFDESYFLEFVFWFKKIYF